ncbi:tetratricopeptide repeat protein [Reichenbachiella sp.]|uniref:tetratricopeptide repeat protein n=1 Tax=Reichenbachiella sp. TaxID=2184521 RepID=UPI003BAE2BB2
MLRLLPLKLCIILTFLSFACSQKKKAPEFQAPLFDQLGNNHFKISTSNEWSQKFFDQGLTLTYGLNHAEAMRSFKEAARLDEECAMCYWGMAYVLGPNINAAMDSSLVVEANGYITHAKQHIDKVTPLEKQMIEAIDLRYPKNEKQTLAACYESFAGQMRTTYLNFRENYDVATLCAEALMDLHPWDYWDTETGEPQPWTGEILDILENTLAANPKHPGANHYYIHATEASRNPDRALEAANTLTDLVPAAGHLVHMPAHIYIRTGNYHEGSVAGELSVIADSLYITNCKAQGIYPLAYYPHNYHFLAATATLEGRGELSIESAFKVAQNADAQLMYQPEWATLQHYYIIPYYILVKFGQWNKVLELPKPDLLYPEAIWHYARGMAFLGTNQIELALSELESLQRINDKEELQQISIWELNTVDHLVRIATLILEAEIDNNKSNSQGAISKLNQAVAIEDQLNYNEPPDWFFSVRHTLGAIYLENNAYELAEKTYLEDLAVYPKNGWALKGLLMSFEAQGKTEEANLTAKKLTEAWQYADFELSSSRILNESIPTFEGLDIKTLTSRLTDIPELPICGTKKKS